MAKKKTTTVRKKTTPNPKASSLKKGDAYKMSNGGIWVIEGLSGLNYKVKEYGGKRESLKNIKQIDAFLKQKIVTKL